jgi:glycosyltransferase involved in cell wall biosynthesis
MKATVNVLLSTYNGSPWLRTLLEPIQNQDNVNVILIWRDDSSSDDSESIVENFVGLKKIKCDHLVQRLGAANSYLHLLQHVSSEEYVAFCDQDDSWFPNKLESQLNLICTISIPAIACTPVKVMDTDKIWPNFNPDFSIQNALFENPVQGCTFLLNPAAVKILREFPKVNSKMHDHWAYVLISIYGEMFFSTKPSLDYRVHNLNDTGLPAMEPFRPAGIVKRLQNFIKSINLYSVDIQNLLKDLEKSTSTKTREVQQVHEGINGNFMFRAKFIFLQGGIRRNKKFDKRVFDLACLIGLFRL